MGRWLPFAPGSSARAAAWRRRPNGQRSLYLGRLYSAAKRIDLANDNRSWPPLRHSHAHTFGSIPAWLQSASRSTRSGLLEERWERCGACREILSWSILALKNLQPSSFISLLGVQCAHCFYTHRTVRWRSSLNDRCLIHTGRYTARYSLIQRRWVIQAARICCEHILWPHAGGP